MRTIKRHSFKLNQGKWKKIKSIAQAYGEEKDQWLIHLFFLSRLGDLQHAYLVRNRAIKEKYSSSYGLQARQWKMALEDAVEALDKN